MTSTLLAKWQKNQIFEAIQKARLDPKEFDLMESDTEVRLKHKWSKSYFIIVDHAGHYSGSYAAGDAPGWPYEVYSWDALNRQIGKWLEEVKNDLETPDLWDELQREAELLSGASDEAAENTPFTADEQKEIMRKLQELSEDVKIKCSLSYGQMRLLEEKVNFLIDAAGHLGRGHWHAMYVGVVVTYILATGIPPETVRSIFMTFMALLRALGSLFEHEPPGLPII